MENDAMFREIFITGLSNSIKVTQMYRKCEYYLQSFTCLFTRCCWHPLQPGRSISSQPEWEEEKKAVMEEARNASVWMTKLMNCKGKKVACRLMLMH